MFRVCADRAGRGARTAGSRYFGRSQASPCSAGTPIRPDVARARPGHGTSDGPRRAHVPQTPRPGRDAEHPQLGLRGFGRSWRQAAAHGCRRPALHASTRPWPAPMRPAPVRWPEPAARPPSRPAHPIRPLPEPTTSAHRTDGDPPPATHGPPQRLPTPVGPEPVGTRGIMESDPRRWDAGGLRITEIPTKSEKGYHHGYSVTTTTP